MMSNRPHDSVGFISWQDALHVWKQVERETNSVIELDVRVAEVKGERLIVSGNLRAYQRSDTGRGAEITFVGFSFPNKDSATVTGALVARLYTLHHYIDRATTPPVDEQVRLPF